MGESNTSVYELVTKLCEKFSGQNVSKKIHKKLRSLSFEIILAKKLPEKPDDISLENNNDPFCHLLAWQFVLITEHNLQDHAGKLQKCIESLQKSNILSDSVLRNVLCMLLQLKRIPENNNIISVSGDICASLYSKQSWNRFRHFDDSKFILQLPVICVNSKFSNESFYLKTKRNVQKSLSVRTSFLSQSKESCTCCAKFPYKISCRSSEIIVRDDEGYESLTKDDYDIWDIATKSKFTDRRTWETIGNPMPMKEIPFLSESSPEVCMLAYDYKSLLLDDFINENASCTKKVISQKQFIRNVKFLLVGMTSDTFIHNSKGEFSLVPGVTVIGITHTCIQSYCKDLIYCGSCYQALNEMCNSTVRSQGRYQNQGFIFRELCESIKRYLSYYRVATLSISENGSLLSVHRHMKNLMSHLDVLTSVCKVGPFLESEQLPDGVALLNYLYQKVTSLSDKDVVMILCSVLYPCIQVYFTRFLQQWIFEGVVNDPYDEFFICTTQKYLNTRGRTYWTRSHVVKEDIVPDFLMELCDDILACGKAMNLLKLAFPSSPLCIYLMGQKPSLLSCCLTSEQLMELKQNASCYYLEVISECGPIFSFSNVLTRSYEQQIVFMNLITKKRSATLKRIEMEKLKKVQEALDRKQRAIAELKAQYDGALQRKKEQMIEDMEKEIKINEDNLKMENLRKKLIQEEANDLIEYYDNLMKISECRRISIEKHIERLKKINLENIISDPIEIENKDTNPVEMSSSSDTFLSASSDTQINVNDIEEDINKEIHSSRSLDVINANSEYVEAETESQTATIANENFVLAQRNKAKVMALELGIESQKIKMNAKTKAKIDDNLTDLQRNRLKVMSSEFGMPLTMETYKKRDMSILEINRRKNIISNECFFEEQTTTIPTCDNENFLNSNVKESINLDNLNNEKNSNTPKTISVTEELKIPTNKPNSLMLDFSQISDIKSKDESSSIFTKFLKSPNFELEKPIPMSIDSTPCTDISSTPRLVSSSFDKEQFDSLMSTAATNFTDEGFNFDEVQSKSEPILYTKPNTENLVQKTLISKRISSKTAVGVSTGYLKLFIHESVSIPLNTQFKLVNNELLKYYINDLQYLMHLNSLRNYFFLLDGEFGRNITEGLFEKLYDVNFPIELINCRTLQHLVYNAMNSSIKLQENSNCLSFKINNLPKTFDLSNPDVLGCLSLTYKVSWPLNILLPSDAIAKYDEVFKFLLKLHLVSWVLKKIFQDLKVLSKEIGKRSLFLMLSPHFLKLHQCRHIMTHFIQTLQNYVVGEVLQTSWDTFEKKLSSIKNLEELYQLHTKYIKNILFMCLLNQRSAPIRKVLHKIFTLILKFYNHLRLKQWTFDEDDGVYVHPNFSRLEEIFLNFEEFVIYLCRASHKVAKVGYQPHLVQLIDMLNVNDYYTKKINSDSLKKMSF